MWPSIGYNERWFKISSVYPHFFYAVTTKPLGADMSSELEPSSVFIESFGFRSQNQTWSSFSRGRSLTDRDSHKYRGDHIKSIQNVLQVVGCFSFFLTGWALSPTCGVLQSEGNGNSLGEIVAQPPARWSIEPLIKLLSRRLKTDIDPIQSCCTSHYHHLCFCHCCNSQYQ